MPLQLLTLDAFKDLDSGKVHEAFQAHLARAAADCWDRPRETKARKVTLEITIEPDPDTEDKISVQARVWDSIPKHQTSVYSMALKRNGQIIFQADSLDDVDQGTLEFNGGENA